MTGRLRQDIDSEPPRSNDQSGDTREDVIISLEVRGSTTNIPGIDILLSADFRYR